MLEPDIEHWNQTRRGLSDENEQLYPPARPVHTEYMGSVSYIWAATFSPGPLIMITGASATNGAQNSGESAAEIFHARAPRNMLLSVRPLHTKDDIEIQI